MQVALFIVLSAIGQSDVRSHLPERLQQAMASRGTETSEIEWTIKYQQGRDAGLVARHVTRTEGATIWQINLGDENGHHRMMFERLPRDESEEAQREAAIPAEQEAGPYHSLTLEGLVWRSEHQRFRTPAVADALPTDMLEQEYPFDFTAAGIGPWYDDLRVDVLGVRGRDGEGFPSATFHTVSRGTKETITGTYGNHTIEWILDKIRGGQPVRAAIYDGDRLLCWSDTELQEIDGRWFPSSIRFYNRGADTPFKVIEVQRASFDQPWHRKGISPEDIGVRFGTQVYMSEGLGVWDGASLIPYEEYSDLVYLYGMRPEPFIIEQLARSMKMTPEEYLADLDKDSILWRERYYREHREAPWETTRTKERDEWDIYVKVFIEEHELDEPRVKRAHELLKRSKRLRDHHLRKHRAELDKSRRTGDGKKVRKMEEIERRIFERVLVRGLKKLIPAEPTVAKSKNGG